MKIARGMLQAPDFETAEADDGEKALEVCRRGLPEAILLDWNMPAVDGYEFRVHLRGLPGGDEPRAVSRTTDNDINAVAHAVHAGANESS